jgi:transposase
MDRSEAEAIYDAGRERCVEVILELAGSAEELAARCEQLTARCERLEERVRRLEEQGRSDSRNSSKPPSQDPPKTRQQRRAEARAKAKELLRAERGRCKAGGQPGHPGSGRELAPEDRIDEIVARYPEACRGCGHEFSEAERCPGRRFGRHQVAVLPPIAVITSEYRTHSLRCPRCRAQTTAQLPGELRASAFGPRLQAAVVTLSARNRISRRDMSEIVGELFGLEISTGAVDAICQRASAALAQPHERLSASVRDFTRHAEGLAQQKAFGEAGLKLTGRLFGAWRSFEAHQDRRRLKREMKPIQSALRALLRSPTPVGSWPIAS